MAIDLTIILKDQVSSAAEKMAASIQKIDSAIEKVAEKGARSMEELGESADKAGSDLVDLANKSDSASDAVGTKVVNASGRAQSAFGKMGSKAEGVAGTIKSKFDSMANGVWSAVGKLWSKFGELTGFSIGDTVFKAGFERLETIDTAKAKLGALGHDAKEVQTLMDNANASVKGTAFGLGEAATTAAGASAAGIATGKDMEQYLRDVANVAAVSGSSMEEMGSIFNKVASNGKISAEEMNQLADRGVPIWKYFADSTGKSMDEVRAAVSSGELGIDDLQKAVQGPLKTAAEDMGKTSFSGAIANTKAAMGRIGAAILGGEDGSGGIFGQLKPLLDDVMGNLDKITEKAKPIGEVLGAVFSGIIDGGKIFFDVIKKILTPIGKLVGGLSKAAGHGDKMKGLADTIAAIAPAIFTVITALLIYKGVMTVIEAINKITWMTNPIFLIVMAVMAVIMILIALQKKFKIFNKLGAIFKKIGLVLIAPFLLVKKVITALIGFFRDRFGKIHNIFKGAAGKLKGVADSKLGRGVTAAAKFMWKGIKFYMFAARHPIQALRKVFNSFKNFFKKAGEKVKDALGGIKDKFDTVFTKIKEFIQPVIDLITDFIEGVEKLAKKIKDLPEDVGNFMNTTGAGQDVPLFAKGTNFAPGGPAILGENGPELVNLPRGSEVKTASQTRQILSGATRNKAQNVTHKTLHIAKFAEQLVIREEADIDKLTMKIARLMGETELNMA